MKPGDRVYVAAGINLQGPDGKPTSTYVVATPMTLVRLDAEVAELLPPAQWQDRMGWPPVHLTSPAFVFDNVTHCNTKAFEMAAVARTKGVPLFCSFLPEPMPAEGGQ